MKKKGKIEEITSQLPGDKVLRRRMKPRRRLRIAPNIPAIFRFLQDATTRTPLIPIILTLIVFWLLFSGVIFLVEHEINEQFASYGDALWWSFAAMHTQGANNPGPITTWGMITGLIWSLFSTIAFFGVIIATLYAYFMLPRRRPSREIVSALQYNLEQLENLSVGELELLRDTTVRIVNAQIGELKQKSSGQ